MTYDEALAGRVRGAIGGRTDGAERKMFGGVAFMDRGHMFVGIAGDDLMVRVGPDAYDDALARPNARPMDFTGRPMKGFVFVSSEGVSDPEDLASWVDLGLSFVRTLPPK
jgi:TfoX/Sxy family transcriptional regulator of competence genes